MLFGGVYKELFKLIFYYLNLFNFLIIVICNVFTKWSSKASSLQFFFIKQKRCIKPKLRPLVAIIIVHTEFSTSTLPRRPKLRKLVVNTLVHNQYTTTKLSRRQFPTNIANSSPSSASGGYE